MPVRYAESGKNVCGGWKSLAANRPEVVPGSLSLTIFNREFREKLFTPNKSKVSGLGLGHKRGQYFSVKPVFPSKSGLGGLGRLGGLGGLGGITAIVSQVSLVPPFPQLLDTPKKCYPAAWYVQPCPFSHEILTLNAPVLAPSLPVVVRLTPVRAAVASWSYGSRSQHELLHW